MTKILEAVTAVILCGEELLMVYRQPFLAAFSGFQAFPGGKVDEADAQGAPLPAFCGAHEPRLMRALLRELQEELQLDLAALAAAPRIDALGTALTPPGAAWRFNTHFFRVQLDHKPALQPDTREIGHAGWARPRDWLAQYRRGELLLAPPTLAVLRALERDLQATRIDDLDQAFQAPLLAYEHVVGVRNLMVRSNTLPPAAHTNCFLLGDSQSHRILVDPSPASDEEMQRLSELVRHYGIHEVFLTHHHPDHHERAPDLARQFGVPIGMSEDTQRRILGAHGQDYFADLDVHHYRDGDLICRWLGEPVRIYEVPGHDEGQLALMPDSYAWCIVGDLIQGIGTVVIKKPEGDMRKYYASLQRLIALNPRVIIPSHGPALGTVHRLEETLRHRQLREQQVLELWRGGRDLDAILAQVYPGLDSRLLPLARMNIESHLDKLRAEGALETA